MQNLYDSARNCYMKGDMDCARMNCLRIISSTIKNKSEVKAKAFNLLGVLKRIEGKLDQAIEYYKKATVYSKDSIFIAGLWMNMAIVYAYLGDIQKSITYSNDVISSGKYNAEMLKLTYSNLGAMYFLSEEWEPALNYSLKSIQIGIDNENFNLGDSYINCALAYNNLNLPDSAELYYKKALSSYTVYYGDSHYKKALGLINYSEFLLENSELKRSSYLLEKSKVILQNSVGRSHPYLAEYFHIKGKILLKEDRVEEAIQNFQEALCYKLQDFTPESIYNNPEDVILPDPKLIEILKYKAFSFERLADKKSTVKNLKASLSTFQLIANYIERLRTGYQSEASKLFLANNEYEIYQEGLRIAYKLFTETRNLEYADHAFEFAERSKYGVLRDLRGENYAKKHAGIPDSLSVMEDELEEQLTGKRILLDQERVKENPNNDLINKLNRQIFRLTQQKGQLIEYLETNYPKYYKLKYENSVVSLNEAKNKIGRNQALLEYTLTNNRLYIFAITKDTTALHALPVDLGFYTQLNRLEKFLRSYYSMEYGEFREPSYYLYTKLIQPAESIIKGKELIIIPDPAISRIPFEALTTEPFRENLYHMYESEPYLLYRYSIGYGFSATLALDPGMSSTAKKRFLGFAPEYPNSPGGLSDIPESRQNLKKISALLFGKSFPGEKSTVRNFMENYKDYRVIHFYVHGMEDSLNPELSQMYFYPGIPGDSDPSLMAYEISNLQTSGNMVVLASCYSGSGVHSKGEGILSIARSFINAGAASEIASLWSASALPTNKILLTFYWNLLKGKNKADALQQAKVRYLNKSNPIIANPRYWSSLILIGNQDPLFRDLRVIFSGLILGFFVAILFIFGRKRIIRSFSKSS